MTTLKAPTVTPRFIQYKDTSHNDGLPDATTGRQIASAFNHVLVHRRKAVFHLGEDEDDNGAVYRFKFKSGSAPTSANLRLRCYFIIGQTTNPASSGDPNLVVDVNGATETYHSQLIDTANPLNLADSPEFHTEHSLYFDLSPNAEYEGTLTLNDRIKVVGAVFFEECVSQLDTAQAHTTDVRKIAAGVAITDDQFIQPIDTANNLRENNGQSVILFSHNDGLSTTSSTFVNAFTGSAGFSNNDRMGFGADLSYRGTVKNPGKVNVKGYAYLEGPTTGSGGFRLVDVYPAAWNTLAEFTVTAGVSQWYEFTATLSGSATGQDALGNPLQPRYYFPHIKRDGTGSTTLHALMVYEC